MAGTSPAMTKSTTIPEYCVGAEKRSAFRLAHAAYGA